MAVVAIYGVDQWRCPHKFLTHVVGKHTIPIVRFNRAANLSRHEHYIAPNPLLGVAYLSRVPASVFGP